MVLDKELMHGYSFYKNISFDCSENIKISCDACVTCRVKVNHSTCTLENYIKIECLVRKTT